MRPAAPSLEPALPATRRPGFLVDSKGMALRTVDRSGDSFTYADIESAPDDGCRYELSYGTLIVTPAPNTRHQSVMVEIAAFLHQRRPPSLRVLAEAELLLQPTLVKRPDIQVVDEDLVGGQSIVGTPLLAVEIHPPATKVLDLTEKRFVYAEAGIPAYWLVDPDSGTVTVLELEAGQYVEQAVLVAGDVLEVSVPFSMTIRPAEMFS